MVLAPYLKLIRERGAFCVLARASFRNQFRFAVTPNQLNDGIRLSDDSKVELFWRTFWYEFTSGELICLLARASFGSRFVLVFIQNNSPMKFVFLTIPKSNCFGAPFGTISRAGGRFASSLALVFVPNFVLLSIRN